MGQPYAVLHVFTGGADGKNPPGGLAMGAAGNLYGTATNGGDYGSGVIFKLDPIGPRYEVLHSFGGVAQDGGFPEAGLLPDGGALYGTTYAGGSSGSWGTVFKLQ
jgi:uncharacterized repeat protein (TIGR03803 family)